MARGVLARACAPLLILLLWAPRAAAHEGPPYPVLVDEEVGPFVLSVWTDPDVGIGTFHVMLDPPKGASLPGDTTVQVCVRPVVERLPEACHDAPLASTRGTHRYTAEVPFDAEETWRVRIVLASATGGGERSVDVEVTPPGFGRWDLLLYLSPFLLIGLLWAKGLARSRAARRGRSG